VPDVLYGQRVHSWVLVLCGKRDVAASFFVDPATARHQLVSAELVSGSAEYLGIESVWNNDNYYVNMQQCSTEVQVRSLSVSANKKAQLTQRERATAVHV